MELHFTKTAEWHDWLENNHLTSDGIWLVYYKKPSGKPRIPYKDAVEEALCYGWIDGKIKRVNDDYYIQWFTPRRRGSRWSKYNISKVQNLIREGRLKQSGLDAYKIVLDKPELIYDNRSDGDPVIPDDLMIALKTNNAAFHNFLKYSLSARRMYIFWLNSAKRSETRLRRIEKIVGFAEKNIPPGMI